MSLPSYSSCSLRYRYKEENNRISVKYASLPVILQVLHWGRTGITCPSHTGSALRLIRGKEEATISHLYMNSLPGSPVVHALNNHMPLKMEVGMDNVLRFQSPPPGGVPGVSSCSSHG